MSEATLFKNVKNVSILGGSFEIHPPKVRDGEWVTDVRRSEANSGLVTLQKV